MVWIVWSKIYDFPMLIIECKYAQFVYNTVFHPFRKTQVQTSALYNQIRPSFSRIICAFLRPRRRRRNAPDFFTPSKNKDTVVKPICDVNISRFIEYRWKKWARITLNL